MLDRFVLVVTSSDQIMGCLNGEGKIYAHKISRTCYARGSSLTSFLALLLSTCLLVGGDICAHMCMYFAKIAKLQTACSLENYKNADHLGFSQHKNQAQRPITSLVLFKSVGFNMAY